MDAMCSHPADPHNVVKQKEEVMRFGRRVAAIVVMFISTIVFNTVALAGECDYCVCKGNDTVNSCTKCCKDAPSATKLELRISDDGKAIIDQNGEEVAKFIKGTQVQMSSKGIKANSLKMQGCMRCYPVCVVWDGKKCVEWMRTCDWDFDCNK